MSRKHIDTLKQSYIHTVTHIHIYTVIQSHTNTNSHSHKHTPQNAPLNVSEVKNPMPLLSIFDS